MIAVPEAVQLARQNIESVPLAFIEHHSKWIVHSLEHMNLCCRGCQAHYWEAARLQHRIRARAGTFVACCNDRDMIVERMRPLCEPLNTMMTSQDGQSRLFLEHLHRWNTLFAFTSIRFNADDRTGQRGPGVQLFQIHGAIYDQQGPLVPPAGREALYSQIYLYDPIQAAQVRSAMTTELDDRSIASITRMLQTVFPFVQLYHTARERFAQLSEQEPNLDIILDPQLSVILESGANMRRENLPTANEVAMILPE